MSVVKNFNCRGFDPLLEDKLCLIFKLAPSVCRMTFPILASLLVRLVVLLPFQLLRLSLATPSRWTPLALSVFLAAEGRKANDSHADCYQYFCVPEYGTANGRLHFHAVHFMRTLPTGSVDPNFGRRVRNRRQLNSLQNTWPYGYSMPIAVRYTQDAF